MTNLDPCDRCGRTPTEVEQANKYAWFGGYWDDDATWRMCPTCVEPLGGSFPELHHVDLAGYTLRWIDGARFAVVTNSDGTQHRLPAVEYAPPDDEPDTDRRGPTRADLSRLLVEHMARTAHVDLD